MEKIEYVLLRVVLEKPQPNLAEFAAQRAHTIDKVASADPVDIGSFRPVARYRDSDLSWRLLAMDPIIKIDTALETPEERAAREARYEKYRKDHPLLIPNRFQKACWWLSAKFNKLGYWKPF